jgi:hypothetical protein
MLYLAKVGKKIGFLFRKTELFLLAKLSSGMAWSSEKRSIKLLTDKANAFAFNSLVIIDRQHDQPEIVDVKDATQLLVNAVVNSVLLQRKLQQQKQEIDAWKRSLAYQAQLLNQRKLEIEEYLEELCHQDIEDLLFDLRQIHFQSFQVEELSQQMIFFAEELQRRSPLYA